MTLTTGQHSTRNVVCIVRTNIEPSTNFSPFVSRHLERADSIMDSLGRLQPEGTMAFMHELIADYVDPPPMQSRELVVETHEDFEKKLRSVKNIGELVEHYAKPSDLPALEIIQDMVDAVEAVVEYLDDVVRAHHSHRLEDAYKEEKLLFQAPLAVDPFISS